MVETPGIYVGPDITAEDVAARFDEVCTLEGATPLANNGEQAQKNAAMTAQGTAGKGQA